MNDHATAHELVQPFHDQPLALDTVDRRALLGRVLPQVKPVSLLDQVRERELPAVAHRPLAGKLLVAYVLAENNSVGYLNERHLRTWNVTEAELHEHALANLRAKAWTPYPGVLGTGKGALLILNSRDGYDAARVLLPELFAAFAAHVPGAMVIGVPNRDFLIAFSDADERVFAQVSAQIAADARTQADALTAQLFTFDGEQLVVYQPPIGN